MELKWLEDLLVLLEEKSVTRAADRRHVTQPAFSRRIRQLEDWLGVEIVDRSTKPVRILPQGAMLETGVRDLVNRHYALRNSVHGKQDTITFIAQHALAISLFPYLIAQVKKSLPDTNFRVITADNTECEALFLKEGELLLCYQSGQIRFDFSHTAVHSEKLGVDRLVPVASKDLAKNLGELNPGMGLPLLMYQQGGFMFNVLSNSCLPDTIRDYRVQPICESAFSASLKQMVLADMGIAWLVENTIQDELREGRFVTYESQLGTASLDIMLYYRPDTRSASLGQLIADLLGVEA